MASFRGWPDAALELYRNLEQDNTRAFWLAHKPTYERDVKAPFEALSELVAEEFGPLRVFRPNRDVRFSKDKSPYKTRAYAVTEGEGGEAYYVEISAAGLTLASGYWMMANDQLDRYRKAVDDEHAGTALKRILADLAVQQLTNEGPGLKTAPRGYPRDHPRVELLRHKSVAVMRRFPPARWLATPAAYDRIVGVWRAARPMNDWLAEHVGPSTEPPADRR
ncbi:MAG TPA: DUF2461 domain-containing protein [Acidimicrobiales bacterium]|nr:DUF2461 domain-containing protein [Acidimicrobiales bacterium]